MALPAEGGALKVGRRSTVGLAECSTEVAVTGKAQVQAQCRQVVVMLKQVKGPCKPQPQLITIKRHALHLLKDLREIDRRTVNFSCNFRQCPTPRQVTR